MDFSNLWKHCYSLTHASFIKYKCRLRGLPLSACHCLTALPAKMYTFNSLMQQNTFDRNIKWTFKDLLPCYCNAIKTNSIEQSARDFRNPPLQAKEGTWVNCKHITAWHYNCEPDSCAVWVSYRQKTVVARIKSLVGIKMPTSFKVTINDHTISPEDNLKNLGVLLDNKLSWKPHVQKVKSQLSRACGILSKLKHYTSPPVLKVVYNSLIQPYLNYSILNWGRDSNATIQPLIKLQNKAIKIINPTNMGSLEDHFQHLNILCLPKLYSFSVGKFMHSYHNKLLPNHFDEYFVPLSSIHYHSTKLATSKNLFLPRVNSSSGKFSLKFIGPKVWSSIPDDIKLSTTFTFKWKLKKHPLHEKNSQLWTLATFHLSNKLLWILVLCNSNLFFVCIYFFVFSVCTFYAFRHEVHFLIFSVLLCFLLYLINKFL